MKSTKNITGRVIDDIRIEKQKKIKEENVILDYLQQINIHDEKKGNNDSLHNDTQGNTNFQNQSQQKKSQV